jgi:hypothetical protein
MMFTRNAKLGVQRGWVLGLALLSLAIPVFAVFFRSEPLIPFADPARQSYYRQMLVALILGLTCAFGAYAGTRNGPSSGGRRLTMGLVSVGLVVSVYLLWTLVGSCGLQILSGACHP